MPQRVRERVRDELRNRLDALLPTAKAQGPAPPGPRAAALPQPIPRLDPDWPVELRLPSGRRMRVSHSPPVARRHDLAAFGRVGAANDRQAFAAIQHQSDALETLRRSHEELAQKVAALQELADRALIDLLQGLARTERRVEVIQSQGRALQVDAKAARVLAARQRQTVRSMAATAKIQQVTAVVHSTQAAAYGQRGSLLATNNLLLAGNQLFWSFIDPLLRSLGLSSGASPSLLAWLAPLGTLVTGHVALGNRQHVRFISGVANFDGGAGVARESLRNRIADNLWTEFQRRTDVPVTTVPVDGAAVAVAAVRQGVLRIALKPEDVSPTRVRVAWMVDLGADIG